MILEDDTHLHVHKKYQKETWCCRRLWTWDKEYNVLFKKRRLIDDFDSLP
jgi:hypothetical protein